MPQKPFDPFQNWLKNPGSRQGQPIAGTPREDKPGSTPSSTVDPRKARRRQVLRFLFHPELGTSFNSMAVSHGMFVRLVTTLFIQAELLPPGYGSGLELQQLKLLPLLAEAYRNLEFSRKGLPKVLFFAAFIGSIGVAVLSVVLFLLALLGTGHPKGH